MTIRRAKLGSPTMHEFVLSTRKAGVEDIHSIDIGKRLLDYGFYAPTVAFPLIVPEALMIEPTETESRETLDGFIAALRQIAREMETSPDLIRKAPHHLPVKRCDEVLAARTPRLKYEGKLDF